MSCTFHRRFAARQALGSLILAATLCLTACDRRESSHEAVYVSVPQVYLRDRLAAVYNKGELVKEGDRLLVLERAKRFVRVRTTNGQEGWVEQRYLVGQDAFDRLQKLAAENRTTPTQSTAVTRTDTNIHLTPARESEHLYQLKEGDKVQILKRATSEKLTSAVDPVKQNGKGNGQKLKPILEDWWLIRDSLGRVGWVLARMVDIDVPLEITQYAEGQRIVGAFLLNQVQDGDKKIPEYLVLATEPHDGLPYDYDQARVFTWNLRRHRYETAYRERHLFGVFPVSITTQNFDKEGLLPVFVLRVQDNDNILERKYKLNTPIVRRVVAEGQKPDASTAAPGRRRARAPKANR
jgi:SH3-like domain-containing protein